MHGFNLTHGIWRGLAYCYLSTNMIRGTFSSTPQQSAIINLWKARYHYYDCPQCLSWKINLGLGQIILKIYLTGQPVSHSLTLNSPSRQTKMFERTKIHNMCEVGLFFCIFFNQVRRLGKLSSLLIRVYKNQF